MQRSKTRRPVLWLPLSALFLTACGPTPEARLAVKIERVVVAPPQALLSCPAEPSRPVALATQDDLAPLLLDVAIAGRACRDQLDAVRRFVDETKP